MTATERLRWFIELLQAGGEAGDDLEAALMPQHLPHAAKIREAIAARAAQVAGARLESIEERGNARAIARLRTPDGARWTSAVSVETSAPYRVYTMWAASFKEQPSPMQIVTDRLLLRPLTDADLDAYIAMEADEDVMRWIGLGGAQDADAARMSFEHMVWLGERSGLAGFAVTDKASGEFLGRAFLGPLLDEIEIGYCFVKPAWGRGIATEAAGAAVAWGFETLRLPRIVGITYPDNLASQKVLEKCGLTRGEDKELIGHRFHYFARDAASN